MFQTCLTKGLANRKNQCSLLNWTLTIIFKGDCWAVSSTHSLQKVANVFLHETSSCWSSSYLGASSSSWTTTVRDLTNGLLLWIRKVCKKKGKCRWDLLGTPNAHPTNSIYNMKGGHWKMDAKASRIPSLRAMRMNLVWPTSCSPRKYFSRRRNSKKHVILPCIDYFTTIYPKTMVWCHEIARFHIRIRHLLTNRESTCESVNVFFRFWDKWLAHKIQELIFIQSTVFLSCGLLGKKCTEAVEKLSQTKIFGSWCYVSRKWVNKNASWEGSLPTSNPRSPVGLRVQGFTSGFIVSCWKSNRRLKLTLNHKNHLIYSIYMSYIYI